MVVKIYRLLNSLVSSKQIKTVADFAYYFFKLI